MRRSLSKTSLKHPLKVLAGVVMSSDKEMKELTVISVSTGTKCVNGEHMSVSGSALNGNLTN